MPRNAFEAECGTIKRNQVGGVGGTKRQGPLFPRAWGEQRVLPLTESGGGEYNPTLAAIA